MKYDFDTLVERRGTHCCKFDTIPEEAGKNAIPVSIADMDLPCAEPIIRALHERIDQRIFGYTVYENEDCKEAVTGWYRKRFGWEIDKNDIFFSPGVVPALAFLIQFLTKEGDGVIIQRPVYHPFTGKVEANGRKVVNSPLVRKGSTYEMDFDDLDRKFADENTKGMILCSPHNPVGRVWREDELRKIVDIAKKYDKWIISDEIHADLTRVGVTHTPLLKLAPDYSDRIIVCTAPSKTFNLAGMQLSNIVIENPEYQKKWLHVIGDQNSVGFANPFGITAMIAAYNESEDWLDQVNAYIDGNIAMCREFVAEHLPRATMVDCEGTYLVWLDLRAYCADKEELEEMMLRRAKVALDEGYMFGEEGIGFERINVACPRSIVRQCLERMAQVLEGK